LLSHNLISVADLLKDLLSIKQNGVYT